MGRFGLLGRRQYRCVEMTLRRSAALRSTFSRLLVSQDRRAVGSWFAGLNSFRIEGVKIGIGGGHPFRCAPDASRGESVIIDAERRLPDELPRRNICIVGGGPAGITLAHRLVKEGQSVLLVESGGRRETERSRALNLGSAEPPDSHEPLEENRRRQWGGASSVWGGRCIPLDDLDFAQREWVPFSGWPIGRGELDPYYAEAMGYCEAGAISFDARECSPPAPEMLRGLDGEGVVTYPLERWSPPTHFGKAYRRKFKSSDNVTVVLNATCTHIQLTPTGESVDHLVISTHNGSSIRVSADRYVLAAGGLENARLLLSSDDIATSGIGNHSDSLGRFYQTHLFGCFAAVDLKESKVAHVGFDRDSVGAYFRRRIWIDSERQQSDHLLNIVFFPVRPPTGASGHRGPLFSAVFLLKTFGSAIRDPAQAGRIWRTERQAIRSHARVFVRHLPGAFPELYRAFVGRYVGSRRLPVILPPDGLRQYYLQYQAEQVPNREARVALGNERDDLGMRRLVVAPRASVQDVDSVVRAHRLLDRRLRTSGLGRLRYREDQLRAAVEESATSVNSGAHHIGTTRMGDDPAVAVVDRTCRVHGIKNLYVLGSSVMPTSGHANPTLTIVALALRLADELAFIARKESDN